VTEAAVAVDDVCPGEVTLLVVSDTVQVPNVIVGRAWLDLPEVAYHKFGGRLYINQAEPCDGVTDTTVNVLGGDADYLHSVKVVGRPVVEPLVIEDFGYVDPQLSTVEKAKLIGLVNKYRECFAKNLSELGCTPLMTVSIHEVQSSRPVVCRPYKTSQADRQEIGTNRE